LSQSAGSVAIVETLERLGRWWGLPLLGVCLGLAGGLFTYHQLPKLYEASTKVLITPPRIPLNYMRSAVPEGTGASVIAMSEPSLDEPFVRRVAEEIYGVAAGSPEERALFGKIRASFRSPLLQYSERDGTALFALIYTDTEPERAARVANLLADIYIEANMKTRADQAGLTAGTIQSLADDAKKELEAQEKAIASFRARHIYELSDHLNANMNMLASRQAALDAVDRDIAAADDRLDMLRSQLAAYTSAPAGTVVVPAEPVDSAARRLAEARRELSALKDRYTDEHPAVRAKERDIQRLEAEVAAQPPRESTAPPAAILPPGVTPEQLKLDITTTEREIVRLYGERERIAEEIRGYEARIRSAPRVEQELAELTRGYDVLAARYRDLQSKAEEAKGSAKVEESQKTSAFEVIERAYPPSQPIRPIQSRVYLGALAVGLALCVGPLLVVGLLAPRVASSAGVELLDEAPVLASISVAPTRAAEQQRRRALSLNAAASLAGIAVLAGVALFALASGG